MEPGEVESETSPEFHVETANSEQKIKNSHSKSINKTGKPPSSIIRTVSLKDNSKEKRTSVSFAKFDVDLVENRPITNSSSSFKNKNSASNTSGINLQTLQKYQLEQIKKQKIEQSELKSGHQKIEPRKSIEKIDQFREKIKLERQKKISEDLIEQLSGNVKTCNSVFSSRRRQSSTRKRKSSVLSVFSNSETATGSVFEEKSKSSNSTNKKSETESQNCQTLAPQPVASTHNCSIRRLSRRYSYQDLNFDEIPEPENQVIEPEKSSPKTIQPFKLEKLPNFQENQLKNLKTKKSRYGQLHMWFFAEI